MISYYGSSGTYDKPSLPGICRGRSVSSTTSLVKGGGEGQIHFLGSGTYPLADYKGSSILVTNDVRGVCGHDGNDLVLVRTFKSVYAVGYVLTCWGDSSIDISGPAETRPTGTGGTSTAVLAAKVTADGKPQAGVAVSFTVDVTANSGGHDHHNAARPKGTLSIAQGTTDANGEVKVTFTPPAIAGIHTIKASCANCTGSPASKEVKVKVPDLVEMPPDTKVPPSYTLVGQTANHASNHWFLRPSLDTLNKVVDTMFKTGWGTVGINDGSLIWGGLFDIKGGWSPSHSEHRTGNEVDISVTNPGLVSPAKKKSTYAELCKKENTAFSLQTLWHVDDGYPEHFHMYLDGTGLTSQAGGGPCCARYKTTRAKNDKNGNPVLDTGGNPVKETVALCEETSPR